MCFWNKTQMFLNKTETSHICKKSLWYLEIYHTTSAEDKQLFKSCEESTN